MPGPRRCSRAAKSTCDPHAARQCVCRTSATSRTGHEVAAVRQSARRPTCAPNAPRRWPRRGSLSPSVSVAASRQSGHSGRGAPRPSCGCRWLYQRGWAPEQPLGLPLSVPATVAATGCRGGHVHDASRAWTMVLSAPGRAGWVVSRRPTALHAAAPPRWAFGVAHPRRVPAPAPRRAAPRGARADRAGWAGGRRGT